MVNSFRYKTSLPSFTLSTSSSASAATACGYLTGSTKYWLGSGAAPELGDIIYNDIEGTSAFDGSDLWWNDVTGVNSIQITSFGEISNVNIC